MALAPDFKLLLLFISVSGIHGYQPIVTGFAPVVAHCCNIGSTWARNHTSCTGPQSSIPEITANDRMACYGAIYICCIRFHREIDCERGKQAAQSGRTCSELPVPGSEFRSPGGEAYKDCCIGCSLGLKAGSLRKPCSSSSNFAFGSPWDKAYEDCCITIAPDLGTSSHTGGCQIHNPCSQICEEREANIRCSCHPGYELSSDQRTCEDINECQLRIDTCNREVESCVNAIGGFQCVSEVAPGKKDPGSTVGSCPSGFYKNPTTKTCDDIDECTTGVCNPITEVCINSIGSYTCSLRNPSGCLPGFKLQQTTGRCIDVDECAEGIHGCDPEHEQCLNSYGVYHCQPKTAEGKSCLAGFKWSDDLGKCEDVDECSERSDSCNRETQVCVNSDGSYTCVAKIADCSPGYRRRSSGGSCEDINECSEGTDDCDKNVHYCINTVGGFQCRSKVPPVIPSCGAGYRQDVSTGVCKDINECIEQTDSCDKVRQYCVNTPGSYQCHIKVPPVVPKCGIGYRPDPGTNSCKDINECEEIRPCLPDQMCDNTQGSYRCRCRQGYQMDSVTRMCKDVNECQLELHTCVGSQRCDNTIGSFTCVRTTSCGTGYTLNAGTSNCEDDDECLLGTHNCGPGFVCRNTLGSFRCDRFRCPPGQRLLSDGSCQVITCSPGMELDSSGNCVDINECTLSNPCRTNQRCVNVVGSYRCQNMLNCGPGFEMNDVGNQCVDVDECSRGIHECTDEQVCRNRPGGYTCECPPGHSLNAQRKCEDIDECTRFRGQICSASSECQNTPGSYTCNCKEGFKKAVNGRNCVDIDECEDSPNICHQKCFNIWGSYKCTCEPGYTIASDGRTCQDIDECSLFEGRGNLCIGLCVNEPGSYSCSCPDGYRLSSDKRTCQDIDECQEQSVCKNENEVCLNTRGNFECNTITCPPNYERDRDHRNRCKRSSVECLRGDAECLNDPLSISYNYITFVSNMRIPPSGQLDLFTMRGPRFTSTTVQFSLDLKDARAGYGTASATREYFHLRRTAFNEAMVSLVKPIPGPQEIELQLTMRMYHNGLFGGTAVARIFIFVTAHEF